MAAITVRPSCPYVNTSWIENQADFARNSCSKTVCSFNTKTNKCIMPLRNSTCQHSSRLAISHSVNRRSFSMRSTLDDETASSSGCDNEVDGYFLLAAIIWCMKMISEWFSPHPCKPGDKIKVSGEVYRVVRINLTDAQLLNEDDLLVTVSNQFFRANDFIRYEDPSVEIVKWNIKFNVKDKKRSMEIAHAIEELLAIEDPSAKVEFEAFGSSSHFTLLVQFKLKYTSEFDLSVVRLLVKCHEAIQKLGAKDVIIEKTEHALQMKKST